jgi:hypothetical protein
MHFRQVKLLCTVLSFYINLMQTTSLQQQLHNVLNNLKVIYLDLVGSKLWAGVTASPHGSSLMAGTANNDEIAQTRAMVAMKTCLGMNG